MKRLHARSNSTISQDTRKKIMPYVSRRLKELEASGWTRVDLAREIRLSPPSRLTEYADFDKYGKSVSERHLILMIAGGVVRVRDAIKKTKGLQDDEKRYLRGLSIHENEKLKDAIIDLEDAGIDPGEILDQFKKAMENGKTADELFKKLIE